MSKVLTFSTVFPSYHYRYGEPTFFVEKILNQMEVDYFADSYFQRLLVWNMVNIDNGKLTYKDIESFWGSLKGIYDKKCHTIRGGNRLKVGESFSPRVWFGVPYNSPQIIFFNDIKVKQTWDIKLTIRGDFKEFSCGDTDLTGTSISLIAKNDGLELNDFLNWFNKPLAGQIICWNETIKY